MIQKTYLSTQHAANGTHIPIVQSYSHVDHFHRTSFVVETWGDLLIACFHSSWLPFVVISYSWVESERLLRCCSVPDLLKSTRSCLP